MRNGGKLRKGVVKCREILKEWPPQLSYRRGNSIMGRELRSLVWKLPLHMVFI